MSILAYVLLVCCGLLLLGAMIFLGTYRYSLSLTYRERFVLAAEFARVSLFGVVVHYAAGEEVNLELKILGFSWKPRWLGKALAKEEKEEKEDRSAGPSPGDIVRLVFDQALRSHLLTLLKELLWVICPREFSLQGTYGFDEPHLTGWAAALEHSLRHMCTTVSVELQPDWQETGFDLQASAGGHFTGLALLACLLRFLLSRNTLRLLKMMRKRKKSPGYAT